MNTQQPGARSRLTREQRHSQLLNVARQLIREDGTDQLTLARVAERAGVAKPLVYDHFGTRSGVLSELYQEFDTSRQAMLDAALDQTTGDLPTVAAVIADAFIDCVVAEGREMSDVLAALAGSPALDQLRQASEAAYLGRCRDALAHVGPPLDDADLSAIAGAGMGVGSAAANGRITQARARTTLAAVIVSVVENRSDAADTRTEAQ